MALAKLWMLSFYSEKGGGEKIAQPAAF